MEKVFAFAFFLFGNGFVYSQTCCSGGVPLSGNIGLPASDKGVWQVALSYDLNSLKTLKSGSETLNDRLRERNTNSVLLEIGYTFSQRLSLDVFLSHVHQERNISTFGQSINTETNGVGDAVILTKYRITSDESKLTWTVGVGPKVPLGSTEKKNQNGITLAADLQPGSGAWDAILWSSIQYPFQFRKSMTLSATSIIRATGKNKDYLGSLTYEFGNEYQLLVGIGDRMALGRLVIDPSLAWRYRKAGRDISNNQEIEATGGEWVFVVPSIGFPLKDYLSLNFTAALPLYSFVNNTQLTPTSRLTAGILFRIK